MQEKSQRPQKAGNLEDVPNVKQKFGCRAEILQSKT